MPPKIIKPDNQTCDILKRMEEIHKAIEQKMDKNRSDMEAQMNNGFSNLESKVDGLIADFRKEISGEVAKVKSDVDHCYSLIKEVDKATSAKENACIAKNNVLERRFNRSDIIIIGLPSKMDKIRERVIKIGQLVGVDVSLSDINHCCYIKGRKCILAKFNSVYLRDSIMKNYYKGRPLLLKDVVGDDEEIGTPRSALDGVDGGVADGAVVDDDGNTVGFAEEPRVFLRDNLSYSSRKLQFICQKLLLQHKIKKFHLINMDNPKAKIFKLDGSTAFLDFQQCTDLLDSTDENVAGVQRTQKNKQKNG